MLVINSFWNFRIFPSPPPYVFILRPLHMSSSSTGTEGRNKDFSSPPPTINLREKMTFSYSSNGKLVLSFFFGGREGGRGCVNNLFCISGVIVETSWVPGNFWLLIGKNEARKRVKKWEMLRKIRKKWKKEGWRLGKIEKKIKRKEEIEKCTVKNDRKKLTLFLFCFVLFFAFHF